MCLAERVVQQIVLTSDVFIVEKKNLNSVDSVTDKSFNSSGGVNLFVLCVIVS